MEFCGNRFRIPCSCKERKWLPPCSGDTCNEVVHEYCGRWAYRIFDLAFIAGWELIKVDFTSGKGWGHLCCRVMCRDCLVKMKQNKI